MVSKKIFIPVVLLLLGGGGLIGISQANAATNTPFSGLAQAIASKFGLDQTKVQDTITQFHKDNLTKRQDMRTQKVEDRLTKLVSDGKLTEAQKQLILAKLKELQSTRQSLVGKTPAERKTQMENERKSVIDWAKQNNIDIKYLWGGLGRKGYMGM